MRNTQELAHLTRPNYSAFLLPHLALALPPLPHFSDSSSLHLMILSRAVVLRLGDTLLLRSSTSGPWQGCARTRHATVQRPSGGDDGRSDGGGGGVMMMIALEDADEEEEEEEE